MSWVGEESHVLLCQGVQPDTSHGTQTHRCSQAVRPLGSCERHRQKPKLLLVICRAVLAGCGGFCSALGLRFICAWLVWSSHVGYRALLCARCCSEGDVQVVHTTPQVICRLLDRAFIRSRLRGANVA